MSIDVCHHLVDPDLFQMLLIIVVGALITRVALLNAELAQYFAVSRTRRTSYTRFFAGEGVN